MAKRRRRRAFLPDSRWFRRPSPRSAFHDLFLCFWLAALPQLVQAQAPAAPVKIGVILPLTGDGAFWGDNARNALLLAADDINRAGGIKGRRLELLIEDGRCDPKASLNAFQKLIDADKTTAVIGEICSSATLAVAPVAERRKIVLLSPCSESADLTNAGQYIFRTWTPNNSQARVVARYLRNEVGARRVAVLAVYNGFGQPLADAFREEFQRLGGEIAAFETYQQGDMDFRAQLLRIRAGAPELIYLVSYPNDGMSAIRQMHALGIDIRVAATSNANSRDFLGPLGPLAEGLLLADLDDTTTPDFRARYEQKFARKWPGASSCAGVAYDDVMILAKAVAAVGEASAAIKDFLAQLKDYHGVSGTITFDENGDLDREHKVYIVHGGELTPAEARADTKRGN
jgi:branched-chain amino acid transport system substrate-binding protein